MNEKKRKARYKHELAVETWRKLGCESVGALELESIQRAIVMEFGQGAVEGPASLARTLADKGATLRHPEVIEADARWRWSRLYELFSPDELIFDTLENAENLIRRFEDLRRQLEAEGDSIGIDSLRALALGIKNQLKLMEHSLSKAVENQRVSREIRQWLTIWLQTPQIFESWLSLRRNSAQFIELFGR